MTNHISNITQYFILVYTWKSKLRFCNVMLKKAVELCEEETYVVVCLLHYVISRVGMHIYSFFFVERTVQHLNSRHLVGNRKERPRVLRKFMMYIILLMQKLLYPLEIQLACRCVYYLYLLYRFIRSIKMK